MRSEQYESSATKPFANSAYAVSTVPDNHGFSHMDRLMFSEARADRSHHFQ